MYTTLVTSPCTQLLLSVDAVAPARSCYTSPYLPTSRKCRPEPLPSSSHIYTTVRSVVSYSATEHRSPCKVVLYANGHAVAPHDVADSCIIVLYVNILPAVAPHSTTGHRHTCKQVTVRAAVSSSTPAQSLRTKARRHLSRTPLRHLHTQENKPYGREWSSPRPATGATSDGRLMMPQRISDRRETV